MLTDINNIYTLVGYYTDKNTLESIDGNIYTGIISYKKDYDSIKNKFIVCNVKYNESGFGWTIINAIVIDPDILRI